MINVRAVIRKQVWHRVSYILHSSSGLIFLTCCSQTCFHSTETIPKLLAFNAMLCLLFIVSRIVGFIRAVTDFVRLTYGYSLSLIMIAGSAVLVAGANPSEVPFDIRCQYPSTSFSRAIDLFGWHEPDGLSQPTVDVFQFFSLRSAKRLPVCFSKSTSRRGHTEQDSVGMV